MKEKQFNQAKTMKYVVLIFIITVSTIEFWFERYEQCQCFLLMALLYNTIHNDLDKKVK